MFDPMFFFQTAVNSAWISEELQADQLNFQRRQRPPGPRLPRLPGNSGPKQVQVVNALGHLAVAAWEGGHINTTRKLVGGFNPSEKY